MLCHGLHAVEPKIRGKYREAAPTPWRVKDEQLLNYCNRHHGKPYHGNAGLNLFSNSVKPNGAIFKLSSVKAE